jgi:hypothetical protein
MLDIIVILKQIVVEITPLNEKKKPRDGIKVPFWAIYSQDDIVDMNTLSALYDMRMMPKVIRTDQT